MTCSDVDLQWSLYEAGFNRSEDGITNGKRQVAKEFHRIT